ncbi:hypothetical protein PDJAM_G00049420 [Pangasius djambal]|uniref:Uncharacterized protein n=1 Tax=Pangasius djambal TaxID=1691987 RepID=A0ACC5YVG7_9TELE|nr:hypothetical protein [Pangasius djambal]
MSVLTDSQVTASCVVETAYNTKVSWLVDGGTKTDTATSPRLDETTVSSNLTISTVEWKKSQTIKCIAEHRCFGKVEKMINITEPVKKIPTVEIRRILAGTKGDSAVLECVGRDLPSGELSVTFQANEAMFPGAQFSKAIPHSGSPILQENFLMTLQWNFQLFPALTNPDR